MTKASGMTPLVLAGLSLAAAGMVFAMDDSGAAAPSDGAAGTESRPSRADAQAPRADSGALRPTVAAGVLRNAAHGFRFPVPEGWALEDGAEADRMILLAEGCEECMIKVVVFPGRAVPVEETARVLRQEASSGENVEVLGEETTKIARETAFTVLVSERPAAPPPGAPAGGGTAQPGTAAGAGSAIVTRYVTFNHKGDKYYVMARGPRERFGAIDAALDRTLGKFRFAP